MNELKHLALILDGNRRWAKERNLPSMEGHRKGMEAVKLLFGDAIKLHKEEGLEEISLWVLSTDNLKRSEAEVSFLMKLFESSFRQLLKNKAIVDNQVRIFFVGRKKLLPKKLQSIMSEVEKKTSKNKGLAINFIIAYGGAAEMEDAMKKAASSGKKFSQIPDYLYKPSMRPIDLVVRTGNASRLSGFLPFHAMYSELKMLPIMWPDFNSEVLKECIGWFYEQKRNFGK